MIKLIYLVYKRSTDLSIDDLNAQLKDSLSKQLQLLPIVKALQINLVDETVAPASSLRQEKSSPVLDAMVSLWVDSLNQRQIVEDVLVKQLERNAVFTGYVVAESAPLDYDTTPVPESGVRSPGFSQIACLSIPPSMSREAWYEHWINEHTQIAIETQSTFRYLQNKVVYALPTSKNTGDVKPGSLEAIVEECFPVEAMADPAVFFDACDDPEKLKQNVKRMMDSCNKFIDFDTINVIPTSEFIFKRLNINNSGD